MAPGQKLPCRDGTPQKEPNQIRRHVTQSAEELTQAADILLIQRNTSKDKHKNVCIFVKLQRTFYLVRTDHSCHVFIIFNVFVSMVIFVWVFGVLLYWILICSLVCEFDDDDDDDDIDQEEDDGDDDDQEEDDDDDVYDEEDEDNDDSVL